MRKDSSVGRAFGFLPSISPPLFHENSREFETHRRQYCSRTFLGQCAFQENQHFYVVNKLEKKSRFTYTMRLTEVVPKSGLPFLLIEYVIERV